MSEATKSAIRIQKNFFCVPVFHGLYHSVRDNPGVFRLVRAGVHTTEPNFLMSKVLAHDFQVSSSRRCEFKDKLINVYGLEATYQRLVVSGNEYFFTLGPVSPAKMQARPDFSFVPGNHTVDQFCGPL